MNPGNHSRRGFLERSFGALTIAAGLPAWYARELLADEQEKEAAARKTIGPNDQIVMGAIGVGGQGTGIMRAAMKQKGVKFVAVCDLDDGHLEKGAKTVGGDCAKYHDFREMLAREKLDAV